LNCGRCGAAFPENLEVRLTTEKEFRDLEKTEDNIFSFDPSKGHTTEQMVEAFCLACDNNYEDGYNINIIVVSNTEAKVVLNE
jgi:hypothetical protein